MSTSSSARVWSGFWQLADPKIWVASTVPMLVAAALAFSNTSRFDITWFVLSVVAVYLIEIGKNAANEFVDYWTGADRSIAPDKRTPFSGGKKTVVDRKLSLYEVLAITALTMLGACALGLYIVVYRERSLFWVGFAGVMLSAFYSLPPLSLAYRGLGEVTVGFTFGPLIMSGMYLVMARAYDPRLVMAALPVGFLITNVLWINQYPDYEADAASNKLNLLVRIGKKRGLGVYQGLFSAAYVSLVLTAVAYRNPLWLLGFASIPLAMRAVSIAKTHYQDVPNLIGANALTVQIYMVTGLAMVLAAISNRWIGS